jgi:hypothetical protein
MRELRGDWRDLFNGFMVALDPRKMFLGFCGLVLTFVFTTWPTIKLGRAMDPDTVRMPETLILHEWWQAQKAAWHVIYTGTAEDEFPFVHTKTEGKVVTEQKPRVVRRGGQPLVKVFYSAAFILVFVSIWAYFGGAISRIAAFEIAKDGERIETRKALRFSRKKFWSLFWAPLICLIGFLFFAFCNYVGGFVGKVVDLLWVGAPLVALLLPLALLSGFVMVLIAIGTAAGLPLFTPAVAAEGTDSFDAVSRGFSYIYSRPWHYLGYLGISSVYGYVCILFVILFAVCMCHLGITAGTAGFELCGAWGKDQFQHVGDAAWSLVLSPEGRHATMDSYAWDPVSMLRHPHPYGRLQTLANQIVSIESFPGTLPRLHFTASFVVASWLVLTLGMALGYTASFFFSQTTLIYFILRKKVDGIEMNEVYEEAEEEVPTAAAPKAPDAPAADDKPKPPPSEPPAEPPKPPPA